MVEDGCVAGGLNLRRHASEYAITTPYQAFGIKGVPHEGMAVGSARRRIAVQ
jgi:hypothetical protein